MGCKCECGQLLWNIRWPEKANAEGLPCSASQTKHTSQESLIGDQGYNNGFCVIVPAVLQMQHLVPAQEDEVHFASQQEFECMCLHVVEWCLCMRGSHRVPLQFDERDRSFETTPVLAMVVYGCSVNPAPWQRRSRERPSAGRRLLRAGPVSDNGLHE